MFNALKVAVILSAVDNMSKTVKGAVDASSKHLTRFSKETSRLGDKAFAFGRQSMALGLAVGLPLVGAVKAAADLEQMQVALKTSFQGSESAAKKAFSIISDFAAKTPYEMQEVMGAYIKLKNMGLDPSTKALEAYGNTASAMGKSLNDMVEAVADAATGEFERLKEFGIRASKQGDIVKFTFQGVTTAVRMDSKQIELYLKNLGMTKFAGGIEAQSKTFNGQLSTMKDNVKMFAASIGKILIPAITDLFKKLQPILESVQKWVEKNPKLTKTIVMGVAAVGALSMAVSVLSFAFGGLMKVVSFVSGAISFLSSAVTFASTAFGFLSTAIRTVTIAMMANPILAIAVAIAAIAVAIYMNWEKVKKFFIDLWNGPLNNKYIQAALVWFFPFIGIPIAIIKNWSKIKQFFLSLWEGIKAIFRGAWQAIKAIIWDYQPPVLIYNNWSKITQFFADLWERVKKKFLSFFDWVMSFPAKFYHAGEAIINNIWNGMKAKFNDMKEWFKSGLKDLRDMLPFSPAKTGPLRDIHRLKFMETIATSIKPAPAVNAMSKAMGAIRATVSPKAGGGGSPALAVAGGGGSVVVNFSPTINMSGASGGSKQDFLTQLKEYEPQLMRVIKEAMARQERKKFG